jgi:hypothetical protein
MAVYGEVGGGGQVGAGERASTREAERKRKIKKRLAMAREERCWRCGGLGLSTCLQRWGPSLLPL